jgi:hypothetical protein
MGEIRRHHLDALAGTYRLVPEDCTIGMLRADLPPGVRWIVVEQGTPERRRWSLADAEAVRRRELDDAEDVPIGLLPQVLTPAVTIERRAQGIGEARWRAWRTRDRVVVVVEDGAFAGIVGDPAHSMTRGKESTLPESRFIRAKVETVDGEPELRTDAFAPGVPHRLTLSIGPHQAGLLAAEAPVPAEATSSDQMLKVTVAAPWITSEGQLFLPARGASSECVLDLGSPPRSEGPQKVTILVFGTGGLLQTATLVGEVTDGEPAAPLALLIDPSLWPARATPVPTLVADPGQVVAAVPSPAGFDISSTTDLEQWSKEVFEDLETNVLDAWASKGKLDAPETVGGLRELARDGVEARGLLFKSLPEAVQEQLGGDGPIELVVRDPTVDVPLEIFYDAPLPKQTATLCPGAAESLRKGTCPHCSKEGSSEFVCPMGFWGLRRVIERRVVEPPESGAEPLHLTTGGDDTDRRVLAPLDKALVARSARVEAARLRILRDTLKRARIGVVNADDWAEWTEEVTGRGAPSLLIAMPHVDQTGKQPIIEIGDKEIQRRDISPEYVCSPPPISDRPGPLVLLLGCETANAAVAHLTVTSQFLRSGASVVVGTRMPVIAEAAPAVGAAIVRALLGAAGTDGEVDLGEAMRVARRDLVSKGNLVALALVVLGDAGWRVPARKAA